MLAPDVLLFVATRGVVITGVTTVTTDGAGPESAAGVLFAGGMLGAGGGVFTMVASTFCDVDQLPARSLTRTEKFEPLSVEAIAVA
jgi:hypothetical protein